MGDAERARQVIPACVQDLPVCRHEDTIVMHLWADMRAPIMAGAQIELLRERLGPVSVQARREVLDRVLIVEREVAAYRALLAEAERQARRGRR